MTCRFELFDDGRVPLLDKNTCRDESSVVLLERLIRGLPFAVAAHIEPRLWSPDALAQLFSDVFADVTTVSQTQGSVYMNVSEYFLGMKATKGK